MANKEEAKFRRRHVDEDDSCSDNVCGVSDGVPRGTYVHMTGWAPWTGRAGTQIRSGQLAPSRREMGAISREWRRRCAPCRIRAQKAALQRATHRECSVAAGRRWLILAFATLLVGKGTALSAPRATVRFWRCFVQTAQIQSAALFFRRLRNVLPSWPFF